MLSYDFGFYLALGFVAQLIDGALGMAYGLIGTSALLASGASPAIASASVHAAECVTTGLAGLSHAWHRNVDWGLVKRLAPAGIAGGIVGAFILTELPENAVKMFVVVYLAGMTLLILRRIFTGKSAEIGFIGVVPIGIGSGFLDAIGGGGWGPMVNSTLIARGESARNSIGSASVCEFFVTIAISVTFLFNLDLGRYATIVLGLIVGGALAAPMAGWFSRVLPQSVLMGMVALIVGGLAVYNFVQLGSA